MKANVPHAARLLVLSVAVAALASCGGGGGGGGGGGPSGPPAPTPVALTDANAQPVVDEVLNMSLSFVSVGGSNTANVGEVPLSFHPRRRPGSRLLLGVVRRQMSTLGLSPAAALPADPCDVAPDMSQGQIVTDPEGTTTTVTITNCYDAGTGETANGTLTVTNIAVTTGESTGHVSHSLTFTQPGEDTFTSGGEFDVDHKVNGNVFTDTLTGGPVNLQIGNDQAILSGFTITSIADTSTGGETASVAGTLGTSVIGGTVTIATTTAFQITASTPGSPPHFFNTGVLVITGAANSTVKFTVLGDESLVGNQVRIEVDPEGDGTFEAPVETTWALL